MTTTYTHCSVVGSDKEEKGHSRCSLYLTPFPTELYKQHLNDLEAFEINKIMHRAFLILVKMGNTVLLETLMDIFL